MVRNARRPRTAYFATLIYSACGGGAHESLLSGEREHSSILDLPHTTPHTRTHKQLACARTVQLFFIPNRHRRLLLLRCSRLLLRRSHPPPPPGRESLRRAAIPAKCCPPQRTPSPTPPNHWGSSGSPRACSCGRRARRAAPGVRPPRLLGSARCQPVERRVV